MLARCMQTFLAPGHTVMKRYDACRPKPTLTPDFLTHCDRFQRLIVRPIADRDPVGFQRLQLLVR